MGLHGPRVSPRNFLAGRRRGKGASSLIQLQHLPIGVLASPGRLTVPRLEGSLGLNLFGSRQVDAKGIASGMPTLKVKGKVADATEFTKG